MFIRAQKLLIKNKKQKEEEVNLYNCKIKEFMGSLFVEQKYSITR
jgi:hypothetical protein